MKHLLIITSTLAAFLLSPRLLVGASPISVTTNPSGFISSDAATVTVTAKIEPHKGNRIVFIDLDCDAYLGTSELHLTEDSLSQVRTVYKNVPPGNCVAIAILHREEKDKIKEYAAFSQVLRILGIGPEPFLA